MFKKALRNIAEFAKRIYKGVKKVAEKVNNEVQKVTEVVKKATDIKAEAEKMKIEWIVKIYEDFMNKDHTCTYRKTAIMFLFIGAGLMVSTFVKQDN